MLSWSILTALLAISGPSSSQKENPAVSDQPQLVTYQVCLSPGCIADGATETLERLQALAPPNVVIKEGSCHSLCGNGPVVDSVVGDSNKVVKHRKVSGQKILDLLFPPDGDERPPQALIDGYELVLEGDKLLGEKEYEQAVEKYVNAIELAFRPAMDWATARDQLQRDQLSTTTTSTKPPIGLEWLVRARRNEARARLELGDVDGAMLAAQGSCNLSRNTSAASFEVLAEVYQRKGDRANELQALKSMFALPVDESKLAFAEQNKRREMGFRLGKLERELEPKKKQTKD